MYYYVASFVVVVVVVLGMLLLLFKLKLPQIMISLFSVRSVLCPWVLSFSIINLMNSESRFLVYNLVQNTCWFLEVVLLIFHAWMFSFFFPSNSFFFLVDCFHIYHICWIFFYYCSAVVAMYSISWSTIWTCFMRWSAMLVLTSAMKGMPHSTTLTITGMAILYSLSKPCPLCSSAWWCRSNLLV